MQREEGDSEVTLAEEKNVRPLADKDRAVLTVIGGPATGSVFPLDADDVVLGRGLEALVRIDDRALSRRHARVLRENSRYYVEDLESTNGTYVEGERVMGKRELLEGSRLQVGHHTVLRFSRVDAGEQRAMQLSYESATRDRLTGLHNRRYFDERLAEEAAFTTRHGHTMTVLLVDVDKLAAVNEAHGAVVGDAVLRALSKVLVRCVRAEDIVARFGGEEFAVLARGATLGSGSIIAQRLVAAVRESVVEHEAGTVSVTISVGVAAVAGAERAETPSAIVERADRALYAAKAAGGNGVRLSS